MRVRDKFLNQLKQYNWCWKGVCVCVWGLLLLSLSGMKSEAEKGNANVTVNVNVNMNATMNATVNTTVYVNGNEEWTILNGNCVCHLWCTHAERIKEPRTHFLINL